MPGNLLKLWETGGDAAIDALFESAPVMLHSIDADGRLVRVSRFWADALGYAPEEMLGRRSTEFLTEASRAYALETVLPMFWAQGKVHSVSYEFLRKDGTVLPVLMSAVAHPGEDRRHSFSLAVIFDNRAAVEALATAERARRDAEIAARAKADFLSNMSHEIRTPLSGITGLLELLGQADLSAEQHRNLAMARQCSQTLLAIVDGVLDLSSLEAGSLTLKERSFEGDLVFGSALSIMESRAVAKGLGFTIRVRPSACRALSGDPDRLTQILYNLVGNAIKFTESGRIEVTVRCDDHPSDDSRLMLVLSVADTGLGIPKSELSEIFERFRQGARGGGGGTGLGLSITRELVTLMGGAITVESAEGEGSLFRCTIPLGVASEPISPRLQPKPEDSPFAGYRLLVAEDNPGNQQVVSGMLRALGCEFDLVSDGEEAVRRCSSSPYDLVLMDVQMPRLDGLSATRRIRADADVSAALPIVALTANVMAEDTESCRRAGMTGHLGKPFTLKGLRRILNQHLRPSAGTHLN